VLLALRAAKAGQVSDEENKADSAEAAVSRLQAREAQLRSTATLATEVSQREAQIQLVLADDVAWTRLFQEIATVIPNDVWLSTFAGQKSSGLITVAANGFDQTSTARWLIRVGELQSLTGLWVPNSTKQGTGTASLVSFQSTANLTPAARSTRAQEFAQGGAS
jgi:Tfp pilus assembly protein PilN